VTRFRPFVAETARLTDECIRLLRSKRTSYPEPPRQVIQAYFGYITAVFACVSGMPNDETEKAVNSKYKKENLS